MGGFLGFSNLCGVGIIQFLLHFGLVCLLAGWGLAQVFGFGCWCLGCCLVLGCGGFPARVCFGLLF